jgi:hypothetical protein
MPTCRFEQLALTFALEIPIPMLRSTRLCHLIALCFLIMGFTFSAWSFLPAGGWLFAALVSRWCPLDEED